MNQPSLDHLLEKVDSRYSLVVVTAKRARAITKDEEDDKTKPVSRSLNEIVNDEINFRRTKQGIK
ncbi:MAG: DNA-directed RNA polymerase subunit omega [Clostridiales bacterium]|nr:DNA-directed RNA polymerase subunit omega [Clostridiales bacterium]MCF8022722.1 DNA-directed RNA polymerase subunit omega [Clostridiales bacterium]